MGLVFRDCKPTDSIIRKENSKELTTKSVNFLYSLGFKVENKNVGNRFKSRI